MEKLLNASDLMPAVRQEGDALVIAVRGELDLHNSPELRTELLDLLARTKAKRLVVNLTQVPYMDSSALAVLVEALKNLMKVGGRVTLFGLQPRVKGLLEIARLATVFRLCKDEAEALSK